MASVKSTFETLLLGNSVKRVPSSSTPRLPAITLTSLRVVADVGRAPLATPSTVDTPTIVTVDVVMPVTDPKVGS